jgi:hypothetical protein
MFRSGAWGLGDDEADRRTYRDFSRGRYPAGLNFGDWLPMRWRRRWMSHSCSKAPISVTPMEERHLSTSVTPAWLLVEDTRIQAGMRGGQRKAHGRRAAAVVDREVGLGLAGQFVGEKPASGVAVA